MLQFFQVKSRQKDVEISECSFLKYKFDAKKEAQRKTHSMGEEKSKTHKTQVYTLEKEGKLKKKN